MPLPRPGADLAAVFAGTTPGTVGLEEEVLLVDPDTHLPVAAGEVVAEAADPRLTQELPASQVELVTRPHRTPAEALTELAGARRRLLDVTAGRSLPVAAAVHPFAPAFTAIRDSPRSGRLRDVYGEVLARQLVGSLQVHVALGDPDRTLAVHNALRSHLPELAALAAAAPFHEGRDTGLASVRPLVAGMLPRQGVPPVIGGWDDFADDLAWGRVGGTVPDPMTWWWELRPHLLHGTLEVRVPDVQPTLAAAAAVVTVVHALVLHLAARHDDGEVLPVHPGWRIDENRWSALRHGVHGRLAHLDSGESTPTAAVLHRLIDRIEGHAPDGLDGARALVDAPTVDALRAAGLGGVVPWLADAFGG